jgi:hypothetical protein
VNLHKKFTASRYSKVHFVIFSFRYLYVLQRLSCQMLDYKHINIPANQAHNLKVTLQQITLPVFIVPLSLLITCDKDYSKNTSVGIRGVAVILIPIL